jgi:hypothetical protein
MNLEPHHITVVVYVDGQKFDVAAEGAESAESLLRRVVEHHHLNRPPEDYKLCWYASGQPLDLAESLRENKVVEGSVLALVPEAGIGGGA